jgi:hypothetical protein
MIVIRPPRGLPRPEAVPILKHLSITSKPLNPQQRLEGYHAQTVPILKHYEPKGIVTVCNANQDMDKVWAEIEAGLAKMA